MFIYSCIIAGIFGGLIGFAGTKLYFMGGLGIFGYTTFIGKAGLDSSVWIAVLATALALIVGLIVGYIVHSDKNEQEQEVSDSKDSKTKDVTSPINGETELQHIVKDDFVKAPLSGDMIKLEQVNDPVFSSLAMGKGIAIKPTSNTIIAPFDATVESLFPTGHAIGLKSKHGTELLIHIGIDTVKLDGQGFKALVNQGDTVVAGQPLIEFDSQIIQKQNFDDTVMIVVTNSNITKDVIIESKAHFNKQDDLFAIIY